MDFCKVIKDPMLDALKWFQIERFRRILVKKPLKLNPGRFLKILSILKVSTPQTH